MAEFQIELTEEAKRDLSIYPAFERKAITAEIRMQLAHLPLLESKNRKKIRDTPIATWELRAGKYRIFYEADAASGTIRIVAIGHMEDNKQFVRGREMKIWKPSI